MVSLSSASAVTRALECGLSNVAHRNSVDLHGIDNHRVSPLRMYNEIHYIGEQVHTYGMIVRGQVSRGAAHRKKDLVVDRAMKHISG